MSRSTQYIGLTKAAKDYLQEKGRPVEADNSITGMFEEKIALGTWWNDDFYCLEEVVQTSPWSSGLMIFTHLVGYFHNDKEKRNPIVMFSWVKNPFVTGEFDYNRGHYWV